MAGTGNRSVPNGDGDLLQRYFAILSGICVVFVVVIFDRRMVSAFDMGMRYLTYLLG